jgi:hypothetical protein
MADFTASQCVKNSGATLNFLAAQETQTIDLSNVADEKVVLVVQNNNNSDTVVNTATITIAPGDFLANVLGTASIDVADNGTCKVLGPYEGVRFKNSASKLTIGVAVTQSGTVSSVSLGVIKLP